MYLSNDILGEVLPLSKKLLGENLGINPLAMIFKASSRFNNRWLYINGNGLLYKCIDVEGKQLVLMHKSERISASKWDIKRLLPVPQFEWDTEVREIDRPTIIGSIFDIIWHEKEQVYVYYISINGKKKKRRYWENELEVTIK